MTTSQSYSTYGRHSNHRSWWTALPAIPRSRQQLDWWAQEDGRAPRYVRLKRCWDDYTHVGGSASDPDRPHPFYIESSGMHRAIALWENFQLWHPGVWAPRLLAAAGLPSPDATITDACWSYEFRVDYRDPEEGKVVKMLDLIVHLRDARGGDYLVAVEAKAGTDKLKKDVTRPDTDPASYRDLRPFLSYDNRHALYLVHDHYRDTVADEVRGSRGILTWETLVEMQAELARCELPPDAAPQVEAVLTNMARRFGLATDLDSTHAGTFGINDAWAKHVQDWVRGASTYVHAGGGELPQPPFDYLRDEPTFADIHRMGLEGRRTYCLDHLEAYWKIPARVPEGVDDPGKPEMVPHE